MSAATLGRRINSFGFWARLLKNPCPKPYVCKGILCKPYRIGQAWAGIFEQPYPKPKRIYSAA